MDGSTIAELLARSGADRGEPVGIAVEPGVGLGIAATGRSWAFSGNDPCGAIGIVEERLRPRWVLWSNDTAITLARADVRVATAWDLAGAHRLIAGGSAADPARIWACLHGLELGAIPAAAPADLFSSVGEGDGDPEDPVRRDGYLRPEWAAGGWRATPERLRRWAELALALAALQTAELGAIADRPHAVATARVESAIELLCAEMTVDGLPMDRDTAEQIVSDVVGPRPRGDAEAAASRARRDAAVLRFATPGFDVDLRSSVQVRAMLRRLGLDVADTRAWRLRSLEDRHPIVGALLEWRKAERVATTYGYAWLDEHVAVDGRLRGTWTGSDGAAGRMTASGGLHNMPADLRPAVAAGPGHVFVRADLGQVEPRVLAAISGDTTLARATLEGDLYSAVAIELGIDRATAKVAVLGAMYGQTTGHGAHALRRLAATYPVAMAFLDRAARTAEAGGDMRTYGGRLVHFGAGGVPGGALEARGVAAARGRYGRNAVVQGAAAELFKMWAVTVRARCRDLGARIVLCLHDELLVQTRAEQADAVARLVSACLDETARRWAPATPVRFIADVSVVGRWSDAKDPGRASPTG